MPSKEKVKVEKIRVCKKCGDELPSDEKSKYCPNCRGERADKWRMAGLATLTTVLGAVGAFLLGQYIDGSDDDNEDKSDDDHMA